jgi:hypothetical protein
MMTKGTIRVAMKGMKVGLGERMCAVLYEVEDQGPS